MGRSARFCPIDARSRRQLAGRADSRPAGVVLLVLIPAQTGLAARSPTARGADTTGPTAHVFTRREHPARGFALVTAAAKREHSPRLETRADVGARLRAAWTPLRVAAARARARPSRARWSRPAWPLRRRPWAVSSADRPLPRIAACVRGSSSFLSPSAASPRPGSAHPPPAVIPYSTARPRRRWPRSAPARPHERSRSPSSTWAASSSSSGPWTTRAGGCGWLPAGCRGRASPLDARSSRRGAAGGRRVRARAAPGRRRAYIGPAAGHPGRAHPLDALVQGRPCRRCCGRRRLADLRPAGALGALPRLRLDDAHPAADAARLADRRPARPPGRRGQQRPAPRHLVWPHRPDEHADRAAECRRRLGPAAAAGRRRRCGASTRLRAARGGRPASRRRHRMGPARTPRRPARPAVDVRVGRGRLDHLRRGAPRRTAGRGGVAIAADRAGVGAAAVLRHTIVSVAGGCSHPRGVGGRCCGAGRGRANGRRRPAPRACARARPGGAGGCRRGGACRRPRQRELHHAGCGLRSTAGASAGPPRAGRGDRHRASGRTAAAPRGPGPAARASERAPRPDLARAGGRPAHAGRGVPGRRAGPGRVCGGIPRHPRSGRA